MPPKQLKLLIRADYNKKTPRNLTELKKLGQLLKSQIQTEKSKEVEMSRLQRLQANKFIPND